VREAAGKIGERTSTRPENLNKKEKSKGGSPPPSGGRGVSFSDNLCENPPELLPFNCQLTLKTVKNSFFTRFGSFGMEFVRVCSPLKIFLLKQKKIKVYGQFKECCTEGQH
jgi:hypothetical protein